MLVEGVSELLSELMYDLAIPSYGIQESWEWISNFIPNFTVHVITHTYRDLSLMLVNGVSALLTELMYDLAVPGFDMHAIIPGIQLGSVVLSYVSNISMSP